jgi:sec-independent protein translocase protein TatB
MLSLPHLAILFIIALLVFGPEKLPELARMLGKAMAEFRRVTYDVRKVVEDEMREMEHQSREADLRRREALLAAEKEKEKAALPESSGDPSGQPSRIAPGQDLNFIESPAGTVPTDPPTGVNAETSPATATPDSKSTENNSDADSSPS